MFLLVTVLGGGFNWPLGVLFSLSLSLSLFGSFYFFACCWLALCFFSDGCVFFSILFSVGVASGRWLSLAAFNLVAYCAAHALAPIAAQFYCPTAHFIYDSTNSSSPAADSWTWPAAKKSVSQVTNHADLPPPPPPPSSSLSPCFSCLFSLSLSLSHSPNFISRFVVQFPEVDVTERGRFFFVDADYAKKGVGGGEKKTRTDKKHIEPESEKSSALVRASVIRSIYGIRTVLGVPRVPLAKHDSPIIPTRYHFSLMCPSMNERQLFVLGKFKSSKRSQVQRESSTFCFNLLSRFAGIIKIRLQKTVVAERFQTKIWSTRIPGSKNLFSKFHFSLCGILENKCTQHRENV